jgi:hypothetical protein
LLERLIPCKIKYDFEGNFFKDFSYKNWYSWNSVQSGVKHHKPQPTKTDTTYIYNFFLSI